MSLDNLNWRHCLSESSDMISEALTSPETVPGVTECAFHRCVQGTRHLGNGCVLADFGASGTLLGALARTLIYSSRNIYLPSLKLLGQSVLELSVAQG